MKKKMFYFCEICGGSSASRVKILNCEQSHTARHIYPVGTVIEFHSFGNRCNEKVKGNIVEQTYNKGYVEPHYWLVTEKKLTPHWIHRRYPIHWGNRVLIPQSWIERVIKEK